MFNSWSSDGFLPKLSSALVPLFLALSLGYLLNGSPIFFVLLILLCGLIFVVQGLPGVLVGGTGVITLVAHEPAPFEAAAAILVIGGALSVLKKAQSRPVAAQLWFGLGVLLLLAIHGLLYFFHPEGSGNPRFVAISLYLMVLALAVGFTQLDEGRWLELQNLLTYGTLVFSTVSVWMPSAWYEGRFRGFTKDPNVLGSLLVVSLVILAAQRLVQPPRKQVKELSWWLATAAGHFMLLLTASRGAMLSLIAAYGVLWLTCRTRLQWRWLLGIAAAIVIAVMAASTLLMPKHKKTIYVNSSFEHSVVGFRAVDASVEVSNLAWDGSSSLRVQGFSQISRLEYNLAPAQVRELHGNELTLSVYVRTEEGSRPVSIGIGDAIGVSSKTVLATEEWQRVSVTRSIMNGTSWIVAMLYTGEVDGDPGAVLYDAVQLESGTVTPWVAVSDELPDGDTEWSLLPSSILQVLDFEQDELNVRPHQADVQLVSSGFEGAGVLISPHSKWGRMQWHLDDTDVVRARGRKVTLSGYVRKLEGSGPLTIGIADSTGTTYAHPQVGTDWQRVEVTRTISPHAGWVMFVLYGGQLEVSDTPALWDSVQVELAPAATPWVGTLPTVRWVTGTSVKADPDSYPILLRKGLSGVLQRFTEPDPGRLAAWNLAIELSRSNPLGIGPGSFERYSANAISARPDGMAPHNSVLRILVELGFPGLAVYFGLIGLSLWRGVRMGKLVKKPMPIALPPIMIGMLIQGLVIDTVHWRHWWLILALPFALVPPSPLNTGERKDG